MFHGGVLYFFSLTLPWAAPVHGLGADRLSGPGPTRRSPMHEAHRVPLPGYAEKSATTAHRASYGLEVPPKVCLA